MNNILDKNSNTLKGAAIWLRTISQDVGLEKHDKKVVIQAFYDFLDSYPELSNTISECESRKIRRNLKIVK
ncbi:hypothetical protein [Clostridium sp. ETTB3]